MSLKLLQYFSDAPEALIDTASPEFIAALPPAAPSTEKSRPYPVTFTRSTDISQQTIALSQGTTTLGLESTWSHSVLPPGTGMLMVFNPRLIDDTVKLLATLEVQISGRYTLVGNLSELHVGPEVCPVFVRVQPVIRATPSEPWQAVGGTILMQSVVTNIYPRTSVSMDGTGYFTLAGSANFFLQSDVLLAGHASWLAAVDQPDLTEPFGSLTAIAIVGQEIRPTLGTRSASQSPQISGSTLFVHLSDMIKTPGGHGGAPSPIVNKGVAPYTSMSAIRFV